MPRISSLQLLYEQQNLILLGGQVLRAPQKQAKVSTQLNSKTHHKARESSQWVQCFPSMHKPDKVGCTCLYPSI